MKSKTILNNQLARVFMRTILVLLNVKPYNIPAFCQESRRPTTQPTETVYAERLHFLVAIQVRSRARGSYTAAVVTGATVIIL